jgi:hypothetical protein
MIIDFWPKATDFNRSLIWGTVGIFVAGMIPITYIIGKPIVESVL